MKPLYETKSTGIAFCLQGDTTVSKYSCNDDNNVKEMLVFVFFGSGRLDVGTACCLLLVVINACIES